MESRYEIKGEEVILGEKGEISVDVVDAATSQPLAVRVVVTASDGSHPDGVGNGVYDDGRFFCEGSFTVNIPSGCTRILLQSGPNYVPLHFEIDAAVGKKFYIRAFLFRWFSPEEYGWYSGDHHVHSQHDRTAKIKTGLANTALQGRANGLNCITEAGSNVSYDNMESLSTDNFLLEYAKELRTGIYVGHVNTPGITKPISEDVLARAEKLPLPTQAIVEAAHDLEGVVIYTHPLAPPHQLHWMGAAEVYSDAVLGMCADAFDIDSRASELLWFSLLNLGNRLTCSSYTDSTLERLHTLTPGDRRVYCQAEELNYREIVEALRRGRTFATNGGPVFAFFSIDEHQPGDTVTPVDGQIHICRAEIRSLYPLKKAELYKRGNISHTFDITNKQGQVHLNYSFEENANSWYVLRVEDELGNWCITSPIYFEAPEAAAGSSALTLLLEISNHARSYELRRDFFAHIIATVSPEQHIAQIQLLKDGESVKRFEPEMGDQIASGKIPVTEIEVGGEYSPGWIWYPSSARKYHFQCDWPITESGSYSVRMTTECGMTVQSDAVYFNRSNPNSHQLSVAHLYGEETNFTLWGYGQEMPLNKIQEPYEDHWWYPYNAIWQVKAEFGDQCHVVYGDHPYHASCTTDDATVARKLSALFSPMIRHAGNQAKL